MFDLNNAFGMPEGKLLFKYLKLFNFLKNQDLLVEILRGKMNILIIHFWGFKL